MNDPLGRVFSTGDELCRTGMAWPAIEGSRSAPRGMPVYELELPTTLVLEDVHRPFMMSPTRRCNYRFGLAEAAWILSGSDDARLIGQFNKRMLEFSDDGEKMWGAYGPRLIGQLDHVLETLRRDRDSRQAVLTTWRPMVAAPETYPKSRHLYAAAGMFDPYADLEHNKVPEWDGSSWRSKDVPCTIAWHFTIRDDKLNLTVFMRSNDAWLGLPYDLLSFTTVQRVVASVLGVEPGRYVHVASNLHLYEQNVNDANMTMVEVRSTEDISLPSFGDTFKTLDARHISYVFHRVLHDPLSDYEVNPVMAPFVAAIHRKPDLWPDFRALMRANGRGRPAETPAG